MKHKTYKISLLVFAIVVGFFQTSTAQRDNKNIILKASLISPFRGNISAEVEYRAAENFAFLGGLGVRRPGESLESLFVDNCIKYRGWGANLGLKYFVLHWNRGGKSKDGISFRPELNYSFRNDISQICPSLVPMKLFNISALSLNGEVAIQKTFFDRLFIEGFLGVGYKLEFTRLLNPEPFAEDIRDTNKRISFPIGLNVGWVF
ncbi:MAG: hypothetical protein H6581_17530 [Bacteroidia bacterium]|nr:hypothetical protein [Bacteroidia bacterium]